MTSSVKVAAHCGKSKQLRVIITNPDATINKEEFFLNDGESREVSIYDRRTLHTMEVEKPAIPEATVEEKPKGKGKKDKADGSAPPPDAPTTDTPATDDAGDGDGGDE